MGQIGDTVEVVRVDKVTDEDVIILDDGIKETFHIKPTMIEMISEEMRLENANCIPKRHKPKGHERPYKYHR